MMNRLGIFTTVKQKNWPNLIFTHLISFSVGILFILFLEVYSFQNFDAAWVSAFCNIVMAFAALVAAFFARQWFKSGPVNRGYERLFSMLDDLSLLVNTVKNEIWYIASILNSLEKCAKNDKEYINAKKLAVERYNFATKRGVEIIKLKNDFNKIYLYGLTSLINSNLEALFDSLSEYNTTYSMLLFYHIDLIGPPTLPKEEYKDEYKEYKGKIKKLCDNVQQKYRDLFPDGSKMTIWNYFPPNHH